MSKQVLMVMPVMKGGGAERVASLLMNEFYRCGHQVEFLLTSSKAEDEIRTDLNKEISLIFLQDQLQPEKSMVRVFAKLVRVCSSAFCKVFETLKKPVPSFFAYLSFISQYRKEIKQLRQIMKEDPDLTVIAFLQPSIPMVVLAARGLPNRIIISERGNPERLMKKRYGEKFIKKYYDSVNWAVFQTIEAANAYPENVKKKGRVISNPIKNDLPNPFIGERNKNITTFCRISKQKNLPMLVEAFAKLHEEHHEYMLRIIGDTINEEGREVKTILEEQIKMFGLMDCVKFLPFSKNVHAEIREDFMYVNSSDYEGISNAMLEAMAIGIPVVCTDCPIGGAHAMIQNEKNGLLVPVGDSQAMYLAMRKVIEDKELAMKMASNGARIRETLSLENVAKKWMELV